MAKNNGSDNDSKMVIGELTSVRIGLIIAFLTIFGAAVYWGGTVNSKLDSIISFQSSTTSTFSELKTKDISIDKAVIDLKTELGKDISDIRLENALIKVSLKAINDKIDSIKR